jgi:putative membrane protein
LHAKEAHDLGDVVPMTTEPVPERIRAILTGPGLVILLPYLYFRYHTLRYRFDEEGIHMKVGILFRRETNLTYSRIQDIHLRSGILQRWLGLANVQIQTASGSAGPELVIEGFKDYEAIRDFLYTRMRGYQTRLSSPRPLTDQVSPLAASSADGQVPAQSASAPSTAGDTEMVSLLLGIRDELRRTRELLEARSPSSRPTPPQPPPRV